MAGVQNFGGFHFPTYLSMSPAQKHAFSKNYKVTFVDDTPLMIGALRVFFIGH